MNDTAPSWQDVRALVQDPQQFASAFARYARSLVQDRGDGEALNELISTLKDAAGFLPELRRHMLVVATREAIFGHEQQHKWVPNLGCDKYMALAWDPSLTADFDPSYWFAEFLCYVNSRLRGHNATIMDELLPGGECADKILPSKHGMDLSQVEDMLGEDNLKKIPQHPDLRVWWKRVQGDDE